MTQRKKSTGVKNISKTPARGDAARKRKKSYRQRVVAVQIAAITLAIFCLLIVAAVLLTRALAPQGETGETSADVQNEQPRDPESGEDTSSGGEDPAEESEALTPVETVSLTVSMVGDCTIGTDIQFDTSRNFNAFYTVNGPSYFFENVKSILETDDLTVVNMEGTLTESENRQDKTFAFKGDPSFAEVLTDGSVEAANLANNHSRDYGDESYTDTIRYLEDAGISTFGYDRTAVVDVKGIQVGLVGIYELADGMERESQVIENINAVRNQGADLVIVSFHWGQEKETYPDDIQKSLAHTAVDNGADLVVGHHPHVLQGIEKYNGKNIVYSLGNFCFGGNSNPSDKDTMIFQQTFSFENGELVQDDVTNIIPCSLSSVSSYNDYRPTPLEGSEKERVMQKIEELSSGI